MKMLDANMILRYLLNDVIELADKAEEIIDNEFVYIEAAVVAEVVYVMNKTYNYPREKVSSGIIDFMRKDNIFSSRKNTIIKGLTFFAETKLDFVDCLLAAYSTEGYEICTFDKKLIKLIQKNDLTEGLICHLTDL